MASKTSTNRFESFFFSVFLLVERCNNKDIIFNGGRWGTKRAGNFVFFFGGGGKLGPVRVELF